jgi:hypothetical protein
MTTYDRAGRRTRGVLGELVDHRGMSPVMPVRAVYAGFRAVTREQLASDGSDRPDAPETERLIPTQDAKALGSAGLNGAEVDQPDADTPNGSTLKDGQRSDFHPDPEHWPGPDEGASQL